MNISFVLVRSSCNKIQQQLHFGNDDDDTEDVITGVDGGGHDDVTGVAGGGHDDVTGVDGGGDDDVIIMERSEHPAAATLSYI